MVTIGRTVGKGLSQVTEAVLAPILRRMPRGLFARSLLIVLAPMLILQTVMLVVFLDRHWELVTRRLSDNTTRNLAFVTDLAARAPAEERAQLTSHVARRLQIGLSFPGEATLPDPVPAPRFDILQTYLTETLEARVPYPVWVDTATSENLIDVRVLLDDGVMRAMVRRSQAYASNWHIFLVWMTGASLVLIVLAVLFLRNQIRPIVRLSEAVRRFGRGQSGPERLEPRGAREVRHATLAFETMRTRIERFVEQRTVMLAGVSHDLRTVLTRFKLQLALLPPADAADLKADVAEMEAMLEAYLDFVKGTGGEAAEPVDMPALVRETASFGGPCDIAFRHEGERRVLVRPQGMRRILTNLITNACRYGARVEITTRTTEERLIVLVDDDGPGIPEHQREQALKPFQRLDEARQHSGEAGGNVGLGLAIANDIARAHGGSLLLESSPLGGLRARVSVPL